VNDFWHGKRSSNRNMWTRPSLIRPLSEFGKGRYSRESTEMRSDRHAIGPQVVANLEAKGQQSSGQAPIAANSLLLRTNLKVSPSFAPTNRNLLSKTISKSRKTHCNWLHQLLESNKRKSKRGRIGNRPLSKPEGQTIGHVSAPETAPTYSTAPSNKFNVQSNRQPVHPMPGPRTNPPAAGGIAIRQAAQTLLSVATNYRKTAEDHAATMSNPLSSPSHESCRH